MSPGDGGLEKFLWILELKFLPDAVAVGFDRFMAEVKLFGDLTRVESAASEFKDLEFAIGQLGDESASM